MHTEEEARELWCPFARVWIYVGDAGAAANREVRDSGMAEESRCLGSKCAAWRWAGKKTEHKIVSKADLATARDSLRNNNWRYVGTCDDGSALYERVLSNAPQVGYCGLSGAPE